jgi:hypothetical protein
MMHKHCRERQCSVADRSRMYKEALYCTVRTCHEYHKGAQRGCELTLNEQNVTESVTDGP